MEKELKINIENGVKEVVILHGTAEPEFHNKAIEVKGGAINSVYEYLSKKVVDPVVIEHSKIGEKLEILNSLK